ncbi:uncharacterized protein LOC130956924 [Arachis stenosperma]|uniref:uncharacterized protein LOC130956924 n=1 Tax=Arachis stenosperma TaxID=217475 RepID=UPI0025AD7136|nr:uncharacterized protein LOC130956924 [Arachis stenosperma]
MSLSNILQDTHRYESVPPSLWKGLSPSGRGGTQSLLRYKRMQLKIGRSGIERKLQLEELECLWLEAYENSRLYNEKVKAVHDKNIKRREFRAGDQGLLYNSRLRLMPDKLRSRWDGPYMVEKIESYGVVHLSHPSSTTFFKVNGHRLKLYHGAKVKNNKELEIFLLKDLAREED